jgi:hypothetical protein
MTMERIGYDSLYKRAVGTARQLAQFLQAFDPQTAMASLATGVEYRLYTPYGNEAAACWIREPR